MRRSLCLIILTCLFMADATTDTNAAEPAFPLNAKRILFMGDSITHAGHYISWMEARFRASDLKHFPEMINLGLPSETCSGLSEPDHPFPRPDMHERLNRALEKTRPDVVVACYGMNDGIYYPFSEDRFAAYKKGVALIIKKVHATGAKLILMTPPAFDPLPLKKAGKLRPKSAEKFAWFAIYEDYDDVLHRYSAWLMTQKDKVEMIIDLHTPVTEYVSAKRKSNPDFTMSPDGVHVNEEGHRVLARAILAAWGRPDEPDPEASMLTLVTKRQNILHASWLSHVGHVRPGVKAGLPIDEAKTIAAKLEQEIADIP